jgi:hypothetical protein
MNERPVTQRMISRAQRIPELQRRAQAMIDYFTTAKLPNELQLDKASRIVNMDTFVTNQICIMQGHWDNPFLTVFVNAYKRLEAAKNKLDELT